jgi:putative sterol carrier protein
MANLLELTSQGDVATISDESKLSKVVLMTPQQLYELWERQPWSSHTIDFTRDREDWAALSDEDKDHIVWFLSSFFIGEERVATQFNGLVGAYETQSEEHFLTTQQVDEARHAIFFKRFMHEVCGLGDGTASGGLEAIRPQLTWGFRKVFHRLDTIADELRRDRSPEMLSAAVTHYHMVVEATLAQPGQHFITDYLARRDILPAFREGMEQIARDEQRHIGFGVKLLADVAAPHESCRRAVGDLLREVSPWGPAVLMPPGWDRNYTEVFGFTIEEIAHEGLVSLTTKLRSAGMPLEELPGPPVLPVGMAPEEISRRGPLLVQAGLLGPGVERPATDAATVELVMDTIWRQLPDVNGTRLTVQLDFADVDPWVLRIGGGESSATPGREPRPDVTLRARWSDWLDVLGGRIDPRRAVLERKLRPRARLSALKALPAVLGGA